MFTRRVLSFILAILWLWPSVVYAQSGALLEANRRGNALYQSGEYEKAIPFWRRALELGEKEFGPNHPITAALLDALAQTYHAQGRHAEAEPLHQRSLAIREKALGPEHPDVAQSLNNLGELHRVQGHYAEAEPLLQRSLAIREKALGCKRRCWMACHSQTNMHFRPFLQPLDAR